MSDYNSSDLVESSLRLRDYEDWSDRYNSYKSKFKDVSIVELTVDNYTVDTDSKFNCSFMMGSNNVDTGEGNSYGQYLPVGCPKEGRDKYIRKCLELSVVPTDEDRVDELIGDIVEILVMLERGGSASNIVSIVGGRVVSILTAIPGEVLMFAHADKYYLDDSDMTLRVFYDQSSNVVRGFCKGYKGELIAVDESLQHLSGPYYHNYDNAVAKLSSFAKVELDNLEAKVMWFLINSKMFKDSCVAYKIKDGHFVGCWIGVNDLVLSYEDICSISAGDYIKLEN